MAAYLEEEAVFLGIYPKGRGPVFQGGARPLLGNLKFLSGQVHGLS